jgi:3-phosphoshikimate 1-carboxyvinyltransferase
LKKALKNRDQGRSIKADIQITGSKSESNRLLILQSLFGGFEIENLSNSDDTRLMQKALASKDEEVYIGHAGTAMRFLTSFFAVADGRETLLTGSERMKQRPIGVLVDALRQLGAEISYEEEEGFPPLRIKGKRLAGGKVRIQGDISSQYISSLLLIGASLENGLNIEFSSKPTSIPYIEMTLDLLRSLNIEVNWTEGLKGIELQAQTHWDIPKKMVVESDWSSASYHYSVAALSEQADILLSSYRSKSLQGDAVLQKIYQDFGVTTEFVGHRIHLKKMKGFELPDRVSYDLVSCPDIAQTIAVTCIGLGVACDLRGLHTLKIKETDRLQALKNELTKFGAKVEISENSLVMEVDQAIKSDVSVPTYNDHRMAMAFAPLALKTDLEILEAEVVSKSYPSFWEDWEYYL